MKVIATAPGFFGCYRNIGDQFEVPDDAKATWFTPVVEATEAKKKSGKTKDGEDSLV